MKKYGLLALLLSLGMCLAACGKDAPAATAPETAGDQVTVQEAPVEGSADGRITEEQALAAIEAHCYAANPELQSIVEAGEYPVYWEVESADATTIVVLYRSYTGALIRYYIDPETGDTYVTEFVPGITDEEMQTDEHFNVREELAN